MRYYLGIDQSELGSGFALVGEQGALVRSTTVRVGKARGSERLDRICTAFVAFVGDADVTAAASEGYSVNSTNRPFDLGMVAGVLRLAAYRMTGREPYDVPPTSLKLFVTANGAADKAAVLYTVKAEWGEDLGDRDDEADAFGLARFAWAVDTRTFARRCEAEAAHALYPVVPRPPKRRRTRDRTPNV